MKALVLARGRGTRMQADDPGASLTIEQVAAAGAGWKALMPILGTPFLDYALSALANAGCREAALVIGPEQREDFGRYLRSRRQRRVALSLVEQPHPRGTADAVFSAAAWVGDDAFLVLNGDNLYPTPAIEALTALDGPGLVAFDRDAVTATGNIPAARVAAFAVVDIDASGRLARIVEKPADGAAGGQAVSMNAWRFDARVLDACGNVPVSPRGEYEIPAAVELAMQRGVVFTAVRSGGPVLDLSGRADVAEVSRRLAGAEPRP